MSDEQELIDRRLNQIVLDHYNGRMTAIEALRAAFVFGVGWAADGDAHEEG